MEKVFFAKGHRSDVYLVNIKNKKYIIKQKRKDIKINTINNEVKFLKLLNKYNIGPRLVKYGKDYVMYKFVYGEYLKDWIKNAENKKKVFKEVLRQCRILDKLKIDKQEMHNPVKHVIISRKIKMIDFERARFVKKAKNVTQFCQFLMKRGFMDKNIGLLKKYKHEQSEENFKEVLRLLI